MKELNWTIPINPEPWAIGSLGTVNRGGRRVPFVGPNPQLQNFQNAIREHIGRLPDGPIVQDCELHFLFWRRVDEYETTAGRKASANYADATNLQKGLEDALQPDVIKNDRQVKRITSEIVAQGPDVVPGIHIALCMPWHTALDCFILIEKNLKELNELDIDVNLGNIF